MLLIAGIAISPTGSAVTTSTNETGSCRTNSVENWDEWNTVSTELNSSGFTQRNSCALDNFNFSPRQFDSCGGNSTEDIDPLIKYEIPPDINKDCLSKWSSATTQGRREDEVHSFLNLPDSTQEHKTSRCGEEAALLHTGTYPPAGVSEGITSVVNPLPTVDFKEHQEEGTSLCSVNVRYILRL